MFRFLGEVRAELTKVTWPTSSDVLRLTLTVILITLVIGFYLGGLDFVFTNLLGLLVR
jgi:preprotein translocase subunit SecE